MIKRLISIMTYIFLISMCVGCQSKQSMDNDTIQDVTLPPVVTLPATLSVAPTIVLPEEDQLENPEAKNNFHSLSSQKYFYILNQ